MSRSMRSKAAVARSTASRRFFARASACPARLLELAEVAVGQNTGVHAQGHLPLFAGLLANR
jgi:hypothetical protein